MMLMKFMMQEHKHFILEHETLLIRRFKYYRDLYETRQDEWIADPREGTSVLSLKNFHMEKNNPEDVALAQRVGVSIGPNAQNIRIGSARAEFVNTRDYLFCVSRGDPEKMKAAMYSENPANPHPYDSCLLLQDEQMFHSVLQRGAFADYETGKLVGVEWNHFQQVRYSDAPGDARKVSHDWCVKRTIFSSQSEARVVFHTQEPCDGIGDTIKIHAPGLAKCFKDIS